MEPQYTLVDETPTRNAPAPGLKLALDLGPLLLFFVANSLWGIFVATALLMGAVLASLATSYRMTRRVSPMAIVSALVVGVFGAITLFLQDETFIKLKPTLIYLLFAAVLLGGLAARKPLVAQMLDAAFDLDVEGWRKLTLRWALFFLALAVLNEVVWRTQSTSVWVSFKVFGFLPLTLVFGALQYPLLTRHASPPSQS
jgi:intracellular septation protein